MGRFACNGLTNNVWISWDPFCWYPSLIEVKIVNPFWGQRQTSFFYIEGEIGKIPCFGHSDVIRKTTSEGFFCLVSIAFFVQYPWILRFGTLGFGIRKLGRLLFGIHWYTPHNIHASLYKDSKWYCGHVPLGVCFSLCDSVTLSRRHFLVNSTHHSLFQLFLFTIDKMKIISTLSWMILISI